MRSLVFITVPWIDGLMSPWNETDGGTSGSGVVRSFVRSFVRPPHGDRVVVVLVVVVARSFAG